MDSFEIEEELMDEVVETPHEQLFDFLYKAGQHHRHPQIARMFSCEVSMEQLILSSRSYILDKEQQYFAITGNGGFLINEEKYVHINDIVASGPLRNRLNRDIAKVPKDKKILDRKCPIHKVKCRLVNYHYGFICYLHVLLEDVRDAVEPAEEITEEPLAVEDDGDIVEQIDLAAERELSKQLDMDALRKENTEVSADEEYALTEESENVPTSILPIFPIGDSQYVLLTDIQALFNIREDYCLAIIAQNLEEDDDFLDPEMDKYMLLDSNVKDSEFFTPAKTLELIYRDASQYRKQLPSEEEFYAAQQKLKITTMGREDVASSSAVVCNTSINLWKRDTVVDDENQKLLVYEDDFIGRAAGKRKVGLGKDSALAQYISRLTFPKFIIYHQKFSKDNAEFPLFAIKTLSRYLGGYPVRWNADKLMLLDKHIAVRIFGQGPGVYALKCKYYLAYAAYGLACGVTDPKLLSDYGKKELLRFGRVAISTMLSLQNEGEPSVGLVEGQPSITVEEVQPSITVEEVQPSVTIEEVQGSEAQPSSVIVEEVEDNEAEPSSKRARVEENDDSLQA